jgi:hypothetical protein
MTIVKFFGCDGCGKGLEVYSPDDADVVLLVANCSEGDSLQRKIHCDKCGFDNVRYWDKHNPS